MAHGTYRLPTRCPMCKGALIERMPSPTRGSFITFHCLFCSHLWKYFLDDAVANQNGEILGQMFVLTKTGKKHKLASVPVHAVREDELKKHLASKTLPGESQKLQREINALTWALEKTQAEDDRLWKVLQADENNAQKAAAWSAAYNKSREMAKQLKEMQTRWQYLRSGEYFFEGMPSGIARTKTDANGRFTLMIPRKGRYGVVAQASRELLDDTEMYYWCIWASLEGETSKRLILNNDNILGAGSPDSALH
jgi:hypothetical protein